jgi:hypothetical protein
MSNDIYILGNDRVFDDTMAIMNSIRFNTPKYPVLLIPYNDNHQRLASDLDSKSKDYLKECIMVFTTYATESSINCGLY